ncbi:PREDICTED: uncharacterized protein LOC107343152 [Acropora digitifera]|uniref:uncharacterized protein LOC107343152 n=1 Tax=Acropora digitifera TaxID=70779 RepID=UPI00077A8686|nr:PREDICTED: uncharacterized protein LOC107343152 [Acropora digitifera]
MINHFASRATQWRIRQTLSQLRQLEKESVADYSHNVRSLCARLSLPRSEWTYYFIHGLGPEIRAYVILQQANHLDEAEKFAQLKEFVLASCDETPTSNTQQLLAQVIEKLSATTRSEDKTSAHKQRMPISQGGTDKYAFCASYDGHFVGNEQSHRRPVIRLSSENTAHVSREEFARDASDLNDLCDHDVDQVENALTKMVQSLTGVIAKFESLVNGMPCSNDTKIVEVDPQVFEVSNVEESDVVFEDAQVDVCDILDHDDVKITEFVVNDSVVTGSHLTKNFTREVSPIAANKKARGETNHGDIVSSEQTQFLNGINSPFHTKDSTISVNMAHLNFRAFIDTGDALPIKQRPYRTSPKCGKQEIDRQVEDMLQKRIIRESVSPWSSPIVLVKKKDGSFRFCVDLRKVNAVTRKDSFLLPLVSDTLDALSGTKYYSTLDLKSGHWQIEMHSESREKTAFVTHDVLYELNVMPFGLTNSGASFQRFMGYIFRGLEYKFALIYIDDIIIFSIQLTII